MLRSFLTAAVVGAGVAAVAAPVPKGPPPPSPQASASFTLGTAVLDNAAKAGPRIKLEYAADGVASTLPVVKPGVGGGAVGVRRQFITLAAVKVTTADGKELTGDDLTKKLSQPVAAVRSTAAFDAEWKKLFADDVLFIEPNPQPAPGGGAVNPVLPGGVIRPLPGGRIVRPVIRPGVLPVEEPPVEKKEEKK